MLPVTQKCTPILSSVENQKYKSFNHQHFVTMTTVLMLEERLFGGMNYTAASTPPPPQQFPQRADPTHMPLKKDCVLFTVIFIRITIQMFYRLSLHRRRIHSELEEVSVCVCLCVWQLWQRGKSLDVSAAASSSSPFHPPLGFSCSVTLSFLSHNLHGNRIKRSPVSTTHSTTNLTINEPGLPSLVRTLLKSLMLVACTGVPMNVR